jgi:hypothetical protein
LELLVAWQHLKLPNATGHPPHRWPNASPRTVHGWCRKAVTTHSEDTTQKAKALPLTASWLPVEFDIGLPARLVDELEGVHAKALHVAVVEWDANVVVQERELPSVKPIGYTWLYFECK